MLDSQYLILKQPASCIKRQLSCLLINMRSYIYLIHVIFGEF